MADLSWKTDRCEAWLLFGTSQVLGRVFQSLIATVTTTSSDADHIIIQAF